MPWPTTYDTFINPGGTLDTPPHDQLHLELAGRLAVIQQTIGLTPQDTWGTVRGRLDYLTQAAAGTGAWATYAPGVVNVSTGVGSVVARWRRVQQFTIEARLEFNFGAGSAITGVVTALAPVPPKTGSLQAGVFTVLRYGLSPRSGTIFLTDDSTLHFVYQSNSSGLWDASGPTTGTTGDQLVAHITFETQAAV